MKIKIELVSVPLLLTLLSTAFPATAEETGLSSGYTYKKDWAVISAPPPPGPYRAVNIDPRVPGVDAIPPLSLDAPDQAAVQPDDRAIPAEALANPPAAGAPAYSPAADWPAAAMQRSPQSIEPGSARRAAPPPPRGGYYSSNQPRHPAQAQPVPPAAYPGYRSQSSYGYYGSPGYQQGSYPQHVPPPPVYDAMMRNQQPYGYPARKGTP